MISASSEHAPVGGPPAATAGSSRGTDTNVHLDETVRGDLREFIRETSLELRPEVRFSDDDDLIDTGVIDSLAFVELIEMIQDRFDIAVRDSDIVEENFCSITAMANYIRGRRAG
jgi:acyl carrier protein